MKKIDFWDDIVAPVFIIGFVMFTLWFLYKIFAGGYHLIEKLIDKL